MSMWLRIIGLAAGFPMASAAAGPPPVQVREDFTGDPGWEARGHVPPASACVTKTMDFGYSPTAHAGGSPGEIGGCVWRSLTPACYARRIPLRTLNDRLRASGRFSVTRSTSSSGVMIGWFHSASRGWRTPNSLVFRIDGEQDRFRVFFEYGTQTWKTGGGTTFEGPYQTTKTPMIPADGRPHTWALEFDPAGAGGDGLITFTMDGQVYTAAMVKGHRAEGAVFDRFGILNVQNSGNNLTVWLDDLQIDGEREDFATDPKWDEAGSRSTFNDCAIRPWHDFGWRDSALAGGEPGEIGGLVWRIEATRPQEALAYGTPAGELSLDRELKASGRICLKAAGADSAILFGWYNARTPIGAPPVNFTGLLVEGPSEVGHYIRPVMRSADETSLVVPRGPIIRPDGRPHTWTIHYLPGPKGRPGTVTATLDDATVSADVPPQLIAGGAALDRFGFLSWHRGGHAIEAYFDDLEYTAQGSGDPREAAGRKDSACIR